MTVFGSPAMIHVRGRAIAGIRRDADIWCDGAITVEKREGGGLTIRARIARFNITDWEDPR